MNRDEGLCSLHIHGVVFYACGYVIDFGCFCERIFTGSSGP